MQSLYKLSKCRNIRNDSQFFRSREKWQKHDTYYSQLANEDETTGRKRALSLMISFILTLVRLRRNFDVNHLMHLFKTSEGTVINTILTWINYMYIKNDSLCIRSNASQVKRNIPNSKKEKFSNVKCIIDFVEFKIVFQAKTLQLKVDL